VEEAIEHVLQACEAIAEAHAAGIIHRDLKPANLFLTKTADGSSTVKVLDFGISKSTDSEADGDGLQLTRSTAVLGSPLYMSPEQINSARNANAQSDIWSLGAILYQLLAGEVPFRTTSFSDLVLMVNTRPPPSLAQIRGDIPPGLDAAVLRSLQKDLTARFTNVAEFAWAIAPYGPPTAQASARSMTRMLEAAGIHVKRPPDVSLTSVPPPPPSSLPSDKPLGITASRAAKTNPNPAEAAMPWPGWVKPVLIGGAVGIVALAIAFYRVTRSRAPEREPVPEVVPPSSATATAISAPPPADTASATAVPMITASAALPPAPATAEPRASASASTGPKRAGPSAPTSTPKATATAAGAAGPQAPPRNPLDIKIKD
jgi:serine/threonine protein kinase